MASEIVPLQVAAAVLQRPVGETVNAHPSMVTLAVRRSKGAMQGYWEFPGGKREPGELLSRCLVREIDEELGLRIQVGGLLGVNTHVENGRTIELHAYLVSQWTGQIRLTVHDKLRWLGVNELDTVKWSPADIPLVELLKV